MRRFTSLTNGFSKKVDNHVAATALRFPYPDPGRLVLLWNRSPDLNITEDWFSIAQYFDIKNGHHGFDRYATLRNGVSAPVQRR
jgi:hypothetical protein